MSLQKFIQKAFVTLIAVSVCVFLPTARASRYVYLQIGNPARTVVSNADGWMATFTKGARSVALRGPSRTFTEPSAEQPFVTSTWVRVLPQSYDGHFDAVDEAWLNAAANDSGTDVIETAMAFVEGAPNDADYGPLDPATGKREEGSDFNDYLGIPWNYNGKMDRPDAEQINSLDSSGYIRMVWGYANALPISLNPDGQAIPRKIFQILDSMPGPGVVVMPNTGMQVTDLSKLQVGDIVFFDADTADGTQIDHVGMYLGTDADGNYRFISSRKTSNGPTFGTDFESQGGKSVLDGVGEWAKAFRAVRRF